MGNEACERFSFYGMRSILTVFLANSLLQAAPAAERSSQAKEVFHLFVMAVYFFPLLGGYLADRYWGRYRTILWLSLVYCVGHGFLAVFEDNLTGFYVGLGLIALGSGGIKPCVSAFVGDQLTAAQKGLMPKVFGAFYWSINFGSLFASLSVPKLLKHYGPTIAFGFPGVLMLIATLIFWLGRRHYHEIPPSGANPHSFSRVLLTALRGSGSGRRGLERAADRHPPEAIEGARAVLGLLKVFAFVPFFWMLFDQKGSTWVLQAQRMDLDLGWFQFEASQLQFVNPALVMMLIPLLAGVIYPAFTRVGYPLSPLRRMTIGMFLAGLSFVMVAVIEVQLDRGVVLSVLWQLFPYIALTLAEVLVSTTGLEFAYAQAPREMKGVIQSFWLLTTSVANLVVAIVAKINVFTGAQSLLFYAFLVSLAGVGLGLVSRGYVSRQYFREA
ncbi:MAG TPA: POT family MFS transporter [Polyangia bacterium]